MSSTDEIAEQIAGSLEYFYDRWQDEKDYEDWSEYTTAAKKLVEDSGGKYISLKKKPFVLRFSRDDVTMDIEVNVRQVKITKTQEEK